MVYDPALGALSCPYCRGTQPISSEQIEAPEYAYDPDSDLCNAPDWGKEGEDRFVCSACGAETVCGSAAMTVSCPFCGSAYVREPDEGKSVIRPETMIPFQKTEKEAGERFSQWAKRRFFAPRRFRKETAAPKMRGVYVPHFTYDTSLLTRYQGEGGRTRTETYTVRVNGKNEIRTRTVTDWYPISGTEEQFTDDTPFCASRGIDKTLLNKIRPFSMKILHVYDPAYLAGFFAERYTVGLGEGFSSIRPQIERRMEEHIKSVRGYDTYRFMNYEHRFQKVTFKHILLPVWISSFRYGEKNYPFLVNGETGKVAGRAPVSFWRVLLAVLAGCAVIAAILLLAFFLSSGTGGYVELFREPETVPALLSV